MTVPLFREFLQFTSIVSLQEFKRVMHIQTASIVNNFQYDLIRKQGPYLEIGHEEVTLISIEVGGVGESKEHLLFVGR